MARASDRAAVMATMEFSLGLEGPDPRATLGALLELEPFRADPASLYVDDVSKRPAAGWLERWLPETGRELYATWAGEGEVVMTYERSAIAEIVTAKLLYERDADAVCDLLVRIPFEVASFGTIHPSWFRPDDPYWPPSFGGLHLAAGWGCAFKGAGHGRLVSRRWLDYGPWRLLRGGDDTSVVQFHDLEADASTALEQAKPAHERMGFSDSGGYLPPGYQPVHALEGVYDERRLIIVVHGRDVDQRELLDACALRKQAAADPRQPLDNVAYVFLEESKAHAHLDELWLRDLECRTIVDGQETRLDAHYQPSPSSPDWVKGLRREHPPSA